MEYRVYQNMTEFAINVEAESEAEAIKIATATENMDNWERYEPSEDNVPYEAVRQDGKKEISREQKELDLLASSASDVINALLTLLEENWDGYSSSDYVLRADDWLKWANGELTDEQAQNVCKDLTGYNF